MATKVPFLYKVKDIRNHHLFLNSKVFGFTQKAKKETVNIDEEFDFKKLNYLLKNNPKVL
tara:strand:+ start:237 stop:416 length:180 start_codon:yes stop_codon:yes gene_type:complete